MHLYQVYSEYYKKFYWYIIIIKSVCLFVCLGDLIKSFPAFSENRSENKDF